MYIKFRRWGARIACRISLTLITLYLILHVKRTAVAHRFLKLITPFIDLITREKLHFNEEVSKYVRSEHLWKDLGGGGL